jgi:hypothetical protein
MTVQLLEEGFALMERAIMVKLLHNVLLIALRQEEMRT